MADWIEGEDCRTPWHYTDDGYQRDGVVNEEKRGHLNELLNAIFDGEKVEIPIVWISVGCEKKQGPSIECSYQCRKKKSYSVSQITYSRVGILKCRNINWNRDLIKTWNSTRVSPRFN